MIHHADDWLTIHGGDARDVLPTLPAESVDCIVTSPPYWGLRDYGNDGQLGLEATPEEYVANLVGVFRELRRVLKPTGTAWLNLGDSYASSGGAPWVNSLKPKDLVGIPWRVVFALQADGWWLRSDIIWAKPNPMPESVTDRPTKAHEYLFLLTKAERYYFDQEAVREADSGQDHSRARLIGQPSLAPPGQTPHTGIRTLEGRNGAGRNLRSVWTIATRPYPGAHFAVFPPELPERCIKAGSSERGVCPECGAPWERVIRTIKTDEMAAARNKHLQSDRSTLSHSDTGHGGWAEHGSQRETIRWQPTCNRHLPYGSERNKPAVVLDPFAGSGTVGLVANRLSRRAILIDLNPAYLEQQMKRNAQVPAGL